LFGLGTRSTLTILGSDYVGNAAGSGDAFLVQGLVTQPARPERLWHLAGTTSTASSTEDASTLAESLEQIREELPAA
jgi:hypothetical protein